MWLKRLGWALGGLLGLVVLVIGGALLYLQTDAGRERVRSLAIGQVEALLDSTAGATVNIDRVEGGFLRGARLYGLVIEQGGDIVARVDTARIDYTLTTLLNRRFSASELYLGGVYLGLRQRADGTFNIQEILKPADPADTTASAFTVAIDRILLRGGRVDVTFWPPSADSTLVLDPVALILEDFVTDADGPRGTLQGLDAVATAPGGREQIALTARGAFDPEAVTLDAFRLQSDASDVTGRGRIALPGEDDPDLLLPGLDLTLAAEPLALADVRAFTGIELYGDPTLALVARTEGDELRFTLDAALDDATAEVEGAFSLDPTGPVAYRAEGSVRNLNPATVTGNPELDARLNADLDVDLVGAALQDLTGPFRLEVRDSRYGDRAIGLVNARGQFNAGRIDLDLDAEIPGLSLAAEGTARPFDDRPRYDFAGRVFDSDFATLTGDPAQAGSVAGTFVIEGTGIEPRSLELTADLDLTRARYGAYTLDALSGRASLQRGTAAFDLDAVLPNGGGRVAAAGTALPFADEVTVRVDEGRLTNVNLAALTGDPAQSSNLTGTFALDLRGSDPQSLTATYDGRLRGSRYGDLNLAALNVDGRLAGGVATFTAEADFAEDGALTARGTVRPFSEPIAYDLTGTTRNLNLAGLTGDPAQDSDLTGQFEIVGRGTDPATLDLTGTIALQDSRYGERNVTDADVALSLRGGELTLDGVVTLDEGQFDLALSGRPFDGGELAFTFRDGTRFRDLDLAALTGNSALESSLNGTFAGRLVGTDPATLTLDGRVMLIGSTFNDARILGGSAELALRDGQATLDARLAFETGALSLQGTARPFADVPTYAFSGTTETLDLVALLGQPRTPEQGYVLTSRFAVEGAGFDPATAVLQGRIDGGDSFVATATVDTLALGFAYDRGLLDVDTLLVRSDLANASGGGQLALFDAAERAPTDFVLDAQIDDTRPLQALLGVEVSLQKGDLRVRATAEAGEPLEVRGDVVARRVRYGEYRLTGLDAAGTLTLDPAGFPEAEGTIAFRALSTPYTLVEQGDVVVAYDGDDLFIDGTVTVDDTRDLRVLARTDFAAGDVILLDTFLVGLDGQRFVLQGPAEIDYSSGYEIAGLTLVSDSALIAADGVINPGGQQNFFLTLERVQIEPITDLIGYPGLGGEVSTTLSFLGSAEDPTVDGTIDIARITSGGERVGALELGVAYADERLSLDAILTHVSGDSLTAAGFLPLDLRLAAVDGDTTTTGAVELGEVARSEPARFTARADSFPIAWIEPFLPRGSVSEIGGRLRLDLGITGTEGQPELNGSALLSGGYLGLPSVGKTYRGITLPLEFEGDSVLVRNARIAENPRDPNDDFLAADGGIRLRQLSIGELDLRLTAESFEAIDTPTYRSLDLTASPEDNLRLSGTIDFPVLTGNVTLASGDIYLTDELVGPQFEAIELTEDDIQELIDTFGYRVTAQDTAVNRFVDALDLDLGVEIQRDVWLRSENTPEFDIEFRGDVTARKTPFAESYQLAGGIEVTRGTVAFQGRTFQVTRGDILFNGPPTEALVDLQAQLEIPSQTGPGNEATILLGFEGRFADEPQITLSADPPLDNADIVSYIATGRPASGLFAGSDGVTGAVESFAVGQLSALLEGAAESALGLDVVQVVQEPRGIVIKFGKYLNARTFATLSQLAVPSENANRFQSDPNIPQFGLEYELRRWVQAQLELGYRNGGGLIFEYAY